MESWGLRGGALKHLSDAVLESVMVFRLAAGAVAEVVVPLGLAKAGFLSGSTGVLGVVAAAEERSRLQYIQYSKNDLKINSNKSVKTQISFNIQYSILYTVD